jgi:Novel toxin 21
MISKAIVSLCLILLIILTALEPAALADKKKRTVLRPRNIIAARSLFRGFTNKQLKSAANKMGYAQTKQYPFNSHGQLVFKRGNEYITRDIDSHKGGAWKVYDSKGNRKGTFNNDLTERIGE